MATKKQAWPKVEQGSHLTVTIHENGHRELKWDDEALLRDVRAAILKAESSVPVTEKKSKHTRKSLAELTKAQLEEVGGTFGIELDRRKKKDELIEDVMKAQRKANK